jgi:hypothetical protein
MLISYRKNIYSIKACQDKKKTSSIFPDTKRKVQSTVLVNLQFLYQYRKQYYIIVYRFKTSVNLNSYTKYFIFLCTE